MRTGRALADPFGLVGATIEGRYRLDEVAASGGFATVFRSVQLRLNRAIAVKVLRRPPDMGDRVWERVLGLFNSEARIIAAARHPNVVQIIDHGFVRLPDGCTVPWMALEWIEGETLRAWLDERGCAPVSPVDAWRFLRPIVDATACIHRLQIAHRDIKPANIMVVTDGGIPSLRLLDLGVAKILEPDEAAPVTGATETRGNGGGFSPQYAAPEQVGGSRTGPWTDVHALGMLLTELIVGQRPYSGTEQAHFLFEALSPVRPTPAKFGLDVGPWESVLARAVARDAPARYSDATALMLALDEVANAAAFPSLSPSLSNEVSTTPVPGVSAAQSANLGAVRSAPRLGANRARALLMVAAACALTTGIAITLQRPELGHSPDGGAPVPPPEVEVQNHDGSPPSTATDAGSAETPSAVSAPQRPTSERVRDGGRDGTVSTHRRGARRPLDAGGPLPGASLPDPSIPL